MVSTPGLVMPTADLDLVSLKFFLFIFFGGLGCLVPGLSLAGHAVGLYTDELYIVSWVAPCVALLGPLVAGLFADRLGAPAQGSAARYGRYLRVMLVISALGGLLYTAVLFIPPVSRRHERNPPVSFFCSPEGSIVMQDQCQEVPCHDWPEDNRGTLLLSGCRYVCGEDPANPGSFLSMKLPTHGDSEKFIDMPKLCFDHNGQKVCHIYTSYSRQLPINVTLKPSLPPTNTTQWCRYSIMDQITCKLPTSNSSEQPWPKNCGVSCDLDDPYNNSQSLLIKSECRHTLGDPQLTFWSYLLLRCLADIFPTTAVALILSCLIVAARDMPVLLCHQLLLAILGYAFTPPLVDLLVDLLPTNPLSEHHVIPYEYYILMFALMSFVSALILTFSRSLPLNPVDYHLQLGPGELTLRGAGGEIGALSLVLVLLGVLSSAIDSYIPWESVVLALIPSLLVLWYSNKLVDYCGHSNILIIAFTFYIIRYTGLLIFEDVMVLFLFGALEVFTLVFSWSTAILYLRHLVPRHFLVTGQAIAVISFFCIGRCLGSILGTLLIDHFSDSTLPTWSDYYSETLYETGAVLSAVIASLYFILYHFFLKHRWRKQNTRVTRPVAQDTNANGTYTPLKIYNPPASDQRIRY